ncbi:isoamyl acetate-hydrolyzing esterase 1 homolog [Babylonia areolata]|uniref:isoamyl acetate-hydrolyzing esterase 1 homolog n=1 Tax=Babylonia areolata TaxID=304850 RepID=UPI003FD0F345
MFRRWFSSSVMAAAVNWPKVILLGDSLTQFSFSSDGCWGALVADHLQRKCDVINRGFSGYNARWCGHMLPQLVSKDLAKNTAAVTIFLGANDANNFETNPRQHVPLVEFQQTLTDMVEHLMSVGVSRDKIILISPPSFNAEAWKIECIKKGKDVTKTNETTGEYAKAVMAVAKECGTKQVDLFSNMMKAQEWKSMLNDGLHLSPSGSQLLFNLLLPILDELTSTLPTMYPLWDEVDLDNLDTSLVPVKKQ